MENQELNGHNYLLNTKWTLGTVISPYSSPRWDLKVMFEFDNIGDMWGAINNSICRDGYSLDYGYQYWFFRTGFLPKYETVAMFHPNVIEMIICGNINKEMIKFFVIDVMGESHELYEKIVGIRIKPSNYGGDLRIWISDSKFYDELRKIIDYDFADLKLEFKINNFKELKKKKICN